MKSPPELWAEVSDVEALAGHLGAFGEIRITRLEPETTVAWEGDRARGTVELEPSGWGTKVTLTALIEGEREDEPEPAAAPEPVARAEREVAPGAGARGRSPSRSPSGARGLFARLFGRRRQDRPPPEPAPAADAQPRRRSSRARRPPSPPPPRSSGGGTIWTPARAEQILAGVLDDLGAARHRPFSRG